VKTRAISSEDLSLTDDELYELLHVTRKLSNVQRLDRKIVHSSEWKW